MAGAPTKYNPDYCEQAEKLCKLGATDKELADFFDVCEDTIYEWKKQYPEFSESIRAGKVIADMRVASALYDGTMDREVIEQQAIKLKTVRYNGNGQREETEDVRVVDLVKIIPADFRNQQFWLKNRKPANWKDKSETEQSGSLTINWNEQLTDEAEHKTE